MVKKEKPILKMEERLFFHSCTPDSFSLKVLSKKPKEEDIVAFTELVKHLSEKDDRENADAVLQVSLTANHKLYDDLKRRYSNMSDVLMAWLKPEIDVKVQEGIQEGIQEGVLRTLSSLVKKGPLSLPDAAKEVNLSPEEFQSKAASFDSKK